MTAKTRGRSELANHPEVVGIAIGACAAGEPWPSLDTAGHGEVAHAHISGPRRGWICCRRLRHYNAITLRHEIAHLIRRDARHDDAWRREVRALGGRVERRYQKRG